MANSGRSEWWQQPSRNTESVGRGASEKTQWSAHSDSLGGSGEGAEAVADSTASGSQASPEECGNTSQEQETVAASPRSGSGGTENVANSISRNVETGRERQREIRKGHQGEGTSDNVACGSEVEKSKNVADTCGTGLSSASSSRNDGESGEESRNEFPAGCGSALDWGDISGNWTVEPNVGRVAHGVPDRIHRIKALGNAVVPQLTYVIGMSIIKALREEK